MGLPEEAEPSPLRSDDVTMARVLSNMTEAILRSNAKGEQKPRSRPVCNRISSVTNARKLQSWRDHRQWYLREVRLYNRVPGVIPMEPIPVVELVSRDDWRAVSEWELEEAQRTEPGEDPNDLECTNWILGKGAYDKAVNRVKGT
jgi:hypothetical protein